MNTNGVSLWTFIAISSVLIAAGDPSSASARQKRSDVTAIQSGGIGDPYFPEDPVGVKNVTAQLGLTTYLHCKVNNLNGKTVSWLKRHGDTPHLLTFGLTTYSSDSRFQIFHEQPNDWKLQIQFPQLSDQGVYECMVSSNPPLVKRSRLTVIVPEIEIVDDRDKKTAEKYYKGGSTIELKCIVRQIVGEPPEYILWHHEDRMLNYDTERGGISVKTDLLKDGAISRLFIAFASKRDTGNYTCSMRNAHASVFVHILDGENPAAMQTGTSHRMQSTAPLLWVFLLLSGTQYLFYRAHWRPLNTIHTGSKVRCALTN